MICPTCSGCGYINEEKYRYRIFQSEDSWILRDKYGILSKRDSLIEIISLLPEDCR